MPGYGQWPSKGAAGPSRAPGNGAGDSREGRGGQRAEERAMLGTAARLA